MPFIQKKLKVIPYVEMNQNFLTLEKPLVLLQISKTAGTTIGFLLQDIIYSNGFNTKYIHQACEGEILTNIFRDGCIGGVQEVLGNREEFNLELHNDIRYLFGHFPLPGENYFGKDVSYISLVRDPVDRVISLANYLIQELKLSYEDILEVLKTRELDNIQTRFLAGEKYMSGPCTEETFDAAIKNINEVFAIVAPTDEISTVMGVIVNQLSREDIAYTDNNITKDKIFSRDDVVLTDLIVARNLYDLRIYDYVKQHWQEWKSEHINSISDNISDTKLYKVVSPSSVIHSKTVDYEYLTYAQIEEYNSFSGDYQKVEWFPS